MVKLSGSWIPRYLESGFSPVERDPVLDNSPLGTTPSAISRMAAVLTTEMCTSLWLTCWVVISKWSYALKVYIS